MNSTRVSKGFHGIAEEFSEDFKRVPGGFQRAFREISLEFLGLQRELNVFQRFQRNFGEVLDKSNRLLGRFKKVPGVISREVSEAF